MQCSVICVLKLQDDREIDVNVFICFVSDNAF